MRLMEKLIPAAVMTLGLLQAEAMFSGAYTLSEQTNWKRLGDYFAHMMPRKGQSVPIANATAQHHGKQSPEHTIYLSTRSDQ